MAKVLVCHHLLKYTKYRLCSLETKRLNVKLYEKHLIHLLTYICEMEIEVALYFVKQIGLSGVL